MLLFHLERAAELLSVDDVNISLPKQLCLIGFTLRQAIEEGCVNER